MSLTKGCKKGLDCDLIIEVSMLHRLWMKLPSKLTPEQLIAAHSARSHQWARSVSASGAHWRIIGPMFCWGSTECLFGCWWVLFFFPTDRRSELIANRKSVSVVGYARWCKYVSINTFTSYIYLLYTLLSGHYSCLPSPFTCFTRYNCWLLVLRQTYLEQ